MKVLHVVGSYPTVRRPHAQVFIRSQVDSLIAAGVDCEVLVLAGPGPWKYLAGWPQVRRRLRGAGFDLIHAHYAYCALPSFGHGLPVVTSFLGSDLYAFPWRDGNETDLDRTIHRALCRFVTRRSAAAIVKARRMRNDLGLPAEVVPNGVDISLFRPASSAEEREGIRAELRMAQGTRYVLFGADPGRPRKRYALAQAAVAAAAPRVGFPLELLPLHGRPHEEIARTMRAGDALLLTSNLEGSPNVVKEAMASNLRIVSVDVGDTRERLEDVAGCRVTADDSPEALGAALAELLGETGEPAGREAVRELSLEAVAERVRGIYRRTLA